MAGNIIIVYDPSIEETENLEKFKVILLKAKFNEDLLSFVSKEDFLATLESVNSSTLPPFVICINQTYKEVSLQYSNILDIPNFEFSSKTYIDSSKKLLLYGLPLDINTIFDTNKYKNFVWSLVNAFLKNYLEFTDNVSDSIIIKKEKVSEEVKEDLIKNTATQIDIKEEPKEEVNKETYMEIPVVVSEQAPSASVLSLLQHVQNLIKEFDIVKEQLNIIAPQLLKGEVKFDL